MTQDITSNGVLLQPTKVVVKTEPGLPVSSTSQPVVSLGTMPNENTVLSSITSVFDPLTPPSSQPTNNNSLRVPDKQAAHIVVPTSNMHNSLVNDGNYNLYNFNLGMCGMINKFKMNFCEIYNSISYIS